MPRRSGMRSLLMGAAALLTATASFADVRSYVWTYEAHTMPRGVAEIETYMTLSSPNSSELEGTVSTEHRFEFEMGMTDHFDVGIYQVFSQGPGEDGLHYDRYQLRLRQRFGEKGQYPVDPLIYFEYQGVPDFSEHVLETKLVLSKDRGPWNFSANPTLEFEFADGETDVEPAYAVGMRYAVSELLRFGLEAKGSESGHLVGPVLSHGRDPFYLAIGTAFEFAEGDEGGNEFQLRMILGIGLN